MRKTGAYADGAREGEGMTTAEKQKAHRLRQVEISRCVLLERNPQYLTPRQMDALKRSIERDGFVVPILVRPLQKKRFEVISGNHRFMAAKELGYVTVPAVIAALASADAKRLAINLNLIHGEPRAEQLAPFLADLDDATLREIHLEGELLAATLSFDDLLGERLASLEDVKGVSNDSVNSPLVTCICPTCQKRHFRASK